MLYARNPQKVRDFLNESGMTNRWPVRSYESFGETTYDAIVNCVGVGDPARAMAMGREILTITLQYDQLILAYISENPSTRYIFLSSGAVFGTEYSDPVVHGSSTRLPINGIQPQHYYGVSKLYAEVTHRSRKDLSIVDLRIFNYVSRRMDLGARFLISEMIAAIRGGRTFLTSDRPLVRDYLHPADMCSLLGCALGAPSGTNTPLDAYSAATLSKLELVRLMESTFGMRTEIVPDDQGIDSSGTKIAYYSENRLASNYGYSPVHTSASAIIDEVGAILNQ